MSSLSTQQPSPQLFFQTINAYQLTEAGVSIRTLTGFDERFLDAPIPARP